MNTRLFKGLIAWNVALTLLVAGLVAANANLAQAANEPPIKVFDTAAALVGGAQGSGENINLNSTNNIELAHVAVTLPDDKPHMCLAFASAKVEHQSGDGVYVFKLGRPGIYHQPSFRRIEMINNPGINDPNYKEVSTTAAWLGVTGTRTIAFYGAKANAGASDTKVTSASLSVICVKKVLD